MNSQSYQNLHDVTSFLPGNLSCNKYRLNSWVLAIYLATFSIISIESGFASLLSNNLNATANLSGVESNSMGITQTSLRQELSANWFKSLTPYLSVDATASYFKTDLDRTHELALFRKDFSPSARISFNHPKVRFNADLSRSSSSGSLLSEELIRNSFSADLQTKMLKKPVVRAQYTRGTTRDNQNHRGKNLSDNTFGVGVTHNYGDWAGRYRLTRTGTRNMVTEFESTSYRHVAKVEWNREIVYKKPIRLFGDYLFSYRTQTDKVPQDSVLRHPISPVSGLYAVNQDATFGWLEPEDELTDNDVSSPTSPSINIGTGFANRHIGANLNNIEQLVGALYIYTDRLSDESVTWEIYVSDDGLTWNLHDLTPDAFFNAGVNRYEILFEQVRTRFIKAISGGANRIETVLVTEIVALAEVTDSRGEVKQSAQSQNINLGATAQLNDKWKADADISYQRVPSVGLAVRRDNFSQTIKATYRPTDVLTHGFRFQTSLNNTSGASDDYSDFTLSYSARYEPLPTLSMTGASSGRVARTNGKAESENLNLSGSLKGDPLDDLSFDVKLGYSWDNRHSVDRRRADTWSTRFSLNARPSGMLNFRGSYGYRSVSVKNGPDIHSQQELFFSSTLRPVRKIQLSGQISKTIGRHRFLRRILSASWSLTRTLSLSGQYRNSEDSEGNKTVRRMASFSWQMGARADIYMGYNKNELSGVGASSESISAGIRMRI